MSFIIKKPPSAVFSRRLVSIKYIQHIQDDLTKAGVHKLDLKLVYLNQTYVLHLVAFWQEFFMDLVDHGFEIIEEREGKGAFAEIARARLVNAKKRFNTPDKENIDKLIKETLNIENISQYWMWNGVSREQTLTTLNAVLSARHQIAHTGRTSSPLTYKINFENMEKLFRMAQITEEVVTQKLMQVPADRYCHL